MKASFRDSLGIQYRKSKDYFAKYSFTFSLYIISSWNI